MTADLEKLLAEATPGRRVQFHGSYCPEAVGTPFTEWDSSHQTSVILPDGKRYRGYATHKHASDAALDALAPDLARQVIALTAENAALRAKAEKLAEALKHALNFIKNTEGEFGESLPCGEASRAALTEWETP